MEDHARSLDHDCTVLSDDRRVARGVGFVNSRELESMDRFCAVFLEIDSFGDGHTPVK